jgi:Fungal Zn(2)-Cys(6) binuclear cluster domain
MADAKTRRFRVSQRACEGCHQKKRRCDGARNGFPCSNCRSDEIHCAQRPGTQKKVRVLSEPFSHSGKNDSTKSPPLPLCLDALIDENLDMSKEENDTITSHKKAVSAMFSVGSNGNGFSPHFTCLIGFRNCLN